jgi:hypothetical protein
MDSYKNALTVLLLLILAAEAVIFFQVRRLIRGWEKDVEKDDKALTDAEQHYVEFRLKLMSYLGTAAVVVYLLRFVFFDLLPLMGR